MKTAQKRKKSRSKEMGKNRLLEVVESQKKGIHEGIYSVCSANPFVIKAALQMGVEDQAHVLIESTCNQVNQFGGYTGMRPADFNNYVKEQAKQLGLREELLILGGDHLGPYPFQNENEDAAMAKTLDMVGEFVSAGCNKIHLDASYRVLGDPGKLGERLPKELIAKRCALMASRCEEEYKKKKSKECELIYVIGTEVPVPGGSDDDQFKITEPEDVEETIEVTKKAFMDEKLEGAWERCVAVVAQPGVEHGDQTIHEYNHAKAVRLTEYVAQNTPFILEGHTTDNQSVIALKNMVEDGIAILKTGQSQTGMAREAVFMLTYIEEELLSRKPGASISNFIKVLDDAMCKNDRHWKSHYSPENALFERKYSFYDRQRYYWTDISVEKSLSILFKNLRENAIPYSLLSQFLPEQYRKVRMGIISPDPEELVIDRIMDHMREYSYAVGYRKTFPGSCQYF